VKVNDLITTLVKIGNTYGLNREELAEFVGYSKPVVARWHRQPALMKLGEFIDWANALGYDVTLRKFPDGHANSPD